MENSNGIEKSPPKDAPPLESQPGNATAVAKDKYVHREIYAIVDKVTGSKMLPLSSDPDFFEDEIDLNEVEREFNPYDGDKIKLFVLNTDPPKAYRIEPDDELQTRTGKITYLTKSYGIVDDDVVFFISDDSGNFELNNQVACTLIEGDYDIGRLRFTLRCESIKQIEEESADVKQWFNEDQEVNENVEEENADSDTENAKDDPRMQFEALRGRQPNEEFYDLPYGLYEILSSRKERRIHQELKRFIPPVLNYNTYRRRGHAYIHLEEVEMKASFEKYKSRAVWIEPENKRFCISCSKVTELRPPIAVGDNIEVRKQTNPSYFYRGVVERVLCDRFILRFKSDFIKNFEMGVPYNAEFFHNRTVFRRKHAAVEYAKQKMPESFLFPKKLTLAKNRQLNAEIKDKKLMLNGKETPWLRDLNEEQQEAVAGALRAECRPYPFIIFGPPGTGKTSTLIEIILQVYDHVPNAKILIATQSNHAANILATRLVALKPDIGEDMLRLVSNAVLDRKSLPKELHKFSASVLHANADDDFEDAVKYDDIATDVKRNCRLNYLKPFKIIVGTCVGMGILFNSEFSENYFTHVIIDEAAQCSECEAMIPISCINYNHGQVIMAGDPLQLPPISLSNHSKYYKLTQSMLERYIEMYKVMDGTSPMPESGFDPRLVVRLRRNYRAIPSILNYYNRQFYDSALVATVCGSTSKEAILLQTLGNFLPQCSDANGTDPFGITFVNVDGRNERLENKKSWENKEEAAIIKSFSAKLVENGVAQHDIGVITPYHAQVLALKKNLKHMKKVRVGTVEEFQGEEKMIIIFSAVKTSGLDKALQFIYCPKRLNTAISRARMLVVMFGKASLLKGDRNWNDLIEYCQENKSFIEGKDIVQIL